MPLAKSSFAASFTEVCYLLIYGELPTPGELGRFEEQLTLHTLLHEDMKKFFEGFPATAHPMAILSAMVASLSAYYPARGDEQRERHRNAEAAIDCAHFVARFDRGQFDVRQLRQILRAPKECAAHGGEQEEGDKERNGHEAMLRFRTILRCHAVPSAHNPSWRAAKSRMISSEPPPMALTRTSR